MGAGGESPCGTRVNNRWADELLIQQDSIPSGEITSPVQEGTQHTHALSNFLSELIDLRRPGEPCI